MGRSKRISLSFHSESLDMFEDRVLLSTLPVSHLHSLRASGVEVAKRTTGAPLQSNPVVATQYAHTLLRPWHSSSAPRRAAGGGPPSSALTPAQVRHIYGFDKISNLGMGQTIAIVDAFDDPNIFNDANVFDKQFMTGLTGGTSYYTAYGDSTKWLTQAFASGTRPSGNYGWGQEISLDVEWMHAIAPLAKILLVEASSNGFSALLAADDYAVSHGATVISNSWGGGEFSGEKSYDSHFAAKGVTFVFSAGDSGNQSYPAESPNVVSVGGTSLHHDANYNWSSESGWSKGGGGVSGYESKPSYQKGVNYANRANPDVAYDADPSTGFAVYDSYGGYSWGQYGGTSAGAPQWAALIAIADQGRVAAHKSILDGVSQTLPALYAMTTGTDGTKQLYDVTTGGNAVGSAGPGYDLATGRGTPRRADLVYQALVNT
jgi:subtilase family serine protease